MEEDKSYVEDPLSCNQQDSIDHDSDVDNDSLSEFDAELDEYLKKSRDKVNLELGIDSDDPLFDDNLNQEEFMQAGFNEDLYVTVSDPEKHVQAMESYITYKVKTKTTRSSFDSSEFVVQRRYHDFLWLSEMLQDEFPTYIIPPLPGKLIMKGLFDRFSSEFTETRCRGLDKFLQRVSNHSILSHSEFLRTFLTSENFTPSKQGIFSRVSSSFKITRANNAEFQSLTDSLSLFGDKMGVMDRVGERMLSERKELSSELKELSLAITEWSKYEEDSTESAMLSVSNCLEECAEKVDASQGAHLFEIIPTIKEYALYADAVRQALKRRDEFEGKFVKCEEDLNARRQEKENLLKTDQSYALGTLMGKTPTQVRLEKEEKLTLQINDLTSQKEKFGDDLVKANHDFKTELQRWKEQKRHDIATTLSKLADCQINFHTDCITAWNSAISIIQSPPNAGEPDDSTPPI